MSVRKVLTAACMATGFWAFGAMAQTTSIEVGQLGQADAYQGGGLVLGQGGLDPALWQGTHADLAADLIARAPLNSTHPYVMHLVRAAIVSPGVPPHAQTPESFDRYVLARLNALKVLGDGDVFADVTARLGNQFRMSQTRANAALIAGDVSGACALADSVQDGRSTPVWARLRGFCHITRQENAAAELTLNLLRDSGYDDPHYYTAMEKLLGYPQAEFPDNISRDPLLAAMVEYSGYDGDEDKRSPQAWVQRALDTQLDAEARMQALYKAGWAISNTQIQTVLSELARGGGDGSATLVGETIFTHTLPTAMAAEGAMRTAQLFDVARTPGLSEDQVKAMELFLREAQSAGALPRFVNAVDDILARLPPDVQVQTDLAFFTQVTILRGDISALQGLYASLIGDAPIKPRLALIADAIGNGFVLGQLGNDIEGRLANSDTSVRGVRDTLIAVAMGAQLSDAAAQIIEGSDIATPTDMSWGALIALEASARKNARAETALRAAIILEGHADAPLSDMAIYRLIRALNVAGLSDFSGQIAAQDFYDGSSF